MDDLISRAAVAKAIADLGKEFLDAGSPTAVKVLNLAADRINALTPASDGRAEGLLNEAVAEIEGWASIYENCSISTGYCCCGDTMENHPNPMDCGHSPVDHGWYVSGQQIESTRAILARVKEG